MRIESEQALRESAEWALVRASVSSLLTDMSPLEAVLTDATGRVVAHLGGGGCSVCTLSDDGHLECKAHTGAALRECCATGTPETHELLALVAHDGVAYLSDHPAEDPRLVAAPWLDERGLAHVGVYPLTASGRTVGVMVVASPAPLHETGIGQLQALIDTMAQYIERKQVEQVLAERTTVLEHRTRRLQELAAELAVAEQRAREELSRVLHDELQQTLFGLSLRLEHATQDLETDPEAARATLARARQDLDEAIAGVRSLAVELAPPMLHDSGLPAALRWLGGWLKDRYGVAVDLTTDPAADPRDRDVRTLLFQCVRELLFNVVKHARVDRVTVDLAVAAPQSIRVTITDNGVGFDPDAVLGATAGRTGLGILSIRERLGLIGGDLQIDSAPGAGSRVTVEIPDIPETREDGSFGPVDRRDAARP